MNDEIDKINEINEEYRKDHSTISPGDQSRADYSKITHPDEDKKRSMAESIIEDLANQRNDIDSIKIGMGQMAEMMNQQTQALNNLAKNLQQPQVAQPQEGASPQLNMESISALGDLAEKAMSAWKIYKGNDAQVVDEFTKQITENAKNEAIESLNIVHLINKKVKGKLVQDIAGDIAGNVINDSTNQNSHAPQ